MTQAEKLEALVRKAHGDGYRGSKGYYVLLDEWRDKRELLWFLQGTPPFEIIFDHDFARALFGEKTVFDLYREPDSTDEYLKVMDDITWVSGYEWDYEAHLFEVYLQGAVISDDPIDYMYNKAFPTEVDPQKPSN